MPKPSFYTLLFAVAIAQLLVASAPGANALQGYVPANPPPVARRAAHVDMSQRMIKKRAPQDDSIVPINVGGDPAASDSAASSAATTQAANTHTSASAAAGQTSSGGGNIIASISNFLNGGSTSSSTSSTSSSTSTSSTSTPATTSTPTTTSTPASRSAAGQSTVTSYYYASASTTAPPAASDPNNSNLPHSVIIGLIVAGSCIAGVAAIWTIIRKWKFSPSRHFEDRLEPINWEPTTSSGVAAHDPTAAALGRSGSRAGTNNRPGSYISDSEHNMASVHQEPISMAPDFPPAHDFTAGPAGAGYVDMHRGPSPAPGAYGGAAAYGGHYETPNPNPYDAYDYNNTGYGQRRY